MESKELYTKLEGYFPHNLDLMRHLNVNACWEYFITEQSTDEEDFKLRYFLYKKSENSLEMTIENPNIKPDLILYFTDEYFNRYRKIMNNSTPGIEIDNKVNKPRLKLWQIGYKNWQKGFKF